MTDTALRELRTLREQAPDGSPADKELAEAIDRVIRARRRLAQQAIGRRTLDDGAGHYEAAPDDAGETLTIYPADVPPERLVGEWVTSDLAVDLEGVR